ncbi:MAG: carboxypeptidase-like regulatory domain-containing protein [Bryobacteraceae bacterium]
MRIVLALLLASVCFAQQPGRVEGRVVTPTGEPVGKATVRLAPTTNVPGQAAAAYVEITSSDGRFVAENVAPGRYNASAQRIGYALTRTNAGVAVSSIFDVAAGETKSGIEIRLTPLAVLTGIVTDADGDPAPGAQVRLLRYAFNQGHAALTTSSATNADDRGGFRLPSVQPGRYYLMASPAANPLVGNEIRGRSAQEMSLPTYYPSATDVRGAVTINAASTEIGNLTVRLRRGGLYSIRGTFIGPEGGPLTAALTVFPKGGETSPPGMMSQTRDPDIFQLGGLPPGEYTLVARGNPPRLNATPAPTGPSSAPRAVALPNQGGALSGRVDVIIGNANLEGVTIRMSEGAEITGRIAIDGGGDPATLITSNTVGNLAGAQTRMPSVMITALEGPGAQLMSLVNSDGTFRIPNIPPLKRLLQVSPLPPNAYIKSVRFRGLDATRVPLDLSTGAGGVLEILIGTKGAEIVPTPRNEKGEIPPAGAGITIWPRTPNPSSPTGDVKFFGSTAGAKAQGLAPGEYYVAAWEATNADYLRDPAFLARFTALATKVSVAEGESIAVEPKIIPREALEKEAAQYP